MKLLSIDGVAHSRRYRLETTSAQAPATGRYFSGTISNQGPSCIIPGSMSGSIQTLPSSLRTSAPMPIVLLMISMSKATVPSSLMKLTWFPLEARPWRGYVLADPSAVWSSSTHASESGTPRPCPSRACSLYRGEPCHFGSTNNSQVLGKCWAMSSPTALA